MSSATVCARYMEPLWKAKKMKVRKIVRHTVRISAAMIQVTLEGVRMGIKGGGLSGRERQASHGEGPRATPRPQASTHRRLRRV